MSTPSNLDGPYGPPPRSKGPVIAIVVAAVLVVVGGAVVAAVLLTGGEDDSAAADETTGSVEATADAFTQAWRDRDCAAFDALLTERFPGRRALQPGPVQGTAERLGNEPGDRRGERGLRDRGASRERGGLRRDLRADHGQ